MARSVGRGRRYSIVSPRGRAAGTATNAGGLGTGAARHAGICLVVLATGIVLGGECGHRGGGRKGTSTWLRQALTNIGLVEVWNQGLDHAWPTSTGQLVGGLYLDIRFGETTATHWG